MKVLISGQHMDIGSSFQAHIEASLNNKVKKYFENAIQATVHLVKDKTHSYKAEILVNEGLANHVFIKSMAVSADPKNSFEDALVKIEKQLRKYKDRLKDHHKVMNFKGVQLIKYTISHQREEEEVAASPIIIAEKPVTIKHLSVSEAVMKMDMLNLPALLFVNSQSKKLSQIYYRNDGNIAWVESDFDN